jgi:hypothetical protein
MEAKVIHEGIFRSWQQRLSGGQDQKPVAGIQQRLVPASSKGLLLALSKHSTLVPSASAWVKVIALDHRVKNKCRAGKLQQSAASSTPAFRVYAQLSAPSRRDG